MVPVEQEVFVVREGGRFPGIGLMALRARAGERAMHLERGYGVTGLAAIAAGIVTEIEAGAERLSAAARGGIEPADRDRLRADANGIVVRAAQGALTASKGAGFVAGHPVERLVRESLFFLVWSCPQSVSDAVLCDLVGGE